MATGVYKEELFILLQPGNRERERERERDRKGPGTIYCQGPTPRDLLPPASSHLPMFLELPKITPTIGDQAPTHEPIL
jgi:hypothetical protein